MEQKYFFHLTRNENGAIVELRRNENGTKGGGRMRIDPKKLEICLARACKSRSDLRDGTSPQTLLRIHNGEEVGTKTAGRIAKALGVDVTEILEEVQE